MLSVEHCKIPSFFNDGVPIRLCLVYYAVMYSWQDIVLAISIFVFNVALIPSVVGKSKPELSTSLLTTVFMTATVTVYVSLSLWYATVMSAVNTVLWGILALQKIKLKKPKRSK